MSEMSRSSFSEEFEREKNQRRVKIRLTNNYYSQYASTTESEPGYDSDNTVCKRELRASTSRQSFYKMIDDRESAAIYRENWITEFKKKGTELVDKIERYTKMSVRMTEDIVRFKCHLEIDGRILKCFTLRIAVVYSPIVRSWAFSPSRCQVPDIIKFPDTQEYFRNPLTRRIISVVVAMRNKALKYFLRQHYLHYFTDKVQNDYLDVKIKLKMVQDLSVLEIELKDDSWPCDLERTNVKDCLRIVFKFDEENNVLDTDYQFTYHCEESPPGGWRENENIVRKILAKIKSSTLEEVFGELMGRKLVGNRYDFHNLNNY